MRAQMCPDVYFGDNNSGAQRRAIDPLSLSAGPVWTYAYLDYYESLKLRSLSNR